ncbi:MAG: BC10 family protein [Provencibacterium sp.]|nr:BC10 family protein [Provencibacterium sp.]
MPQAAIDRVSERAARAAKNLFIVFVLLENLAEISPCIFCFFQRGSFRNVWEPGKACFPISLVKKNRSVSKLQKVYLYQLVNIPILTAIFPYIAAKWPSFVLCTRTLHRLTNVFLLTKFLRCHLLRCSDYTPGNPDCQSISAINCPKNDGKTLFTCVLKTCILIKRNAEL